MTSVHDNRIKSYSVDGVARTIQLTTESEAGLSVGVQFTGVEAYSFKNDNFGNIIFSIAEIPVSALLSEYEAQFTEGVRWAWPGWWSRSAEARAEHFQASGAQAYELPSSLGMTGWVIAKELLMERGT